MPSPVHIDAPGVWITRAEPGARGTAQRVAALGLQPVIAPLLCFRPVAAELKLGPGEALAFTSINGVVRGAALTDRRDLVVFAVGDVTAGAARAAGFTDVTSAGGDVEALAALIVDRRPPGGVAHLAAIKTAGDLVGRLKADGVGARTVAAYDTLSADRLPPPVAHALTAGTLGVVLIHSPKAARVVASLVNEAASATLCVIGLSQACLAPLRPMRWRELVAASTPTEDALMAALFGQAS